MAWTEGCEGGSANTTEQPRMGCAVKLFVHTGISVLDLGVGQAQECTGNNKEKVLLILLIFCASHTTLGTLCHQPALHSLCGKESEWPAGGRWRGWGALFIFWVYSIRIFLYRWSLVLWTYSWRNKLLRNILPDWAYIWILNFCCRFL